MSVCACAMDWDNNCVGDCVMRNRTARTIPKRGNICPNCKQPVEIGTRCVDHAGIIEDWGFFNRFHESCFELMEVFGEQVCDGGWAYPFDLDDAAKHAVAHAHEPVWREWLELYETVWPRLEAKDEQDALAEEQKLAAALKAELRRIIRELYEDSGPYLKEVK